MADDTCLEPERAARDAILVEKVGVRLTPEYIAERYDLEPRDFTPVQQGIEDGLADLDPPDPISPELVRAAVLAARDEDDLRARLSALVPQAEPRFALALERASFAAAVPGYVAAEERRA